MRFVGVFILGCLIGSLAGLGGAWYVLKSSSRDGVFTDPRSEREAPESLERESVTERDEVEQHPAQDFFDEIDRKTSPTAALPTVKNSDPGPLQPQDPATGLWLKLLKLNEVDDGRQLLEFYFGRDFGVHQPQALNLARDALTRTIRHWINKKLTAAAEEWLNRFLLHEPGDQQAKLLQAELYAAIGKALDAARLYRELALQSLDSLFQTELEQRARDSIAAHILFLENNELWAELIAFYQQVNVMGDPKYMEWIFKTAQAHWKLNQGREALELLDVVIHDATLGPKASRFQEQIRSSLNITPLDSSPWSEVPLVSRNGGYFVRVLLNHGVEAVLLLDTGASQVHLSFAMAEKLGYRQRDYLGSRWFITASGKIQSPIVRLDKLTLAGFEVLQVEAGLGNFDHAGFAFDGILGMNVLKTFDFTVEAQQNLLRLKPKPR